jgi:hypothetical protein
MPGVTESKTATSKATSRTSTPRADARKECFDLLHRAYVEARYNSRCRITREQLENLAGRGEKLQRLTRKICKATIASYAAPQSQ